MLACIGEMFDDGDEICGVVVSVRKAQDRISIWTKSTKKDTCMRIGKKMKEVLKIPNGQLLTFQSHADSAARNTSYTQDMYSV